MRRLPVIIVIVLGILGIGVAVYKARVAQPASGKLRVVTSFYPLYYFASEIAGDKADVTTITPEGVEPHDYDPSTRDIADIEKSDLLILNGSVETWGDKIRAGTKGTRLTVVTAAEGLFTQQVKEGGQLQIDTHTWLDPVLAQKEARAITLGLARVDPSNAAYYEENEKKLDDKLIALDRGYRAGLTGCRQKNIITSHTAFGYVASRYNLRQIPIAGLSPNAEPSAQQLADIVKLAKDAGIKYIFFETLVSPKLSQTIAAEIGGQTLVLDPLEGVSDADRKAGKDYYSIMQDNLKNLKIALECNS